MAFFTIDELNELSFVIKPHLSAFHLNIRSLKGHFSELIELLDSIPFVFDFMAFSTETNMVSDDHTYSSGGGVALYLKNGYDFQIH